MIDYNFILLTLFLYWCYEGDSISFNKDLWYYSNNLHDILFYWSILISAYIH